MDWKGKILGLGAALAMGVSIASPAAAVDPDTIDVSVDVDEGGAGNITFYIESTDNADFGTVSADAAESATNGINTDLAPKVFTIVMDGDDKLYRDGGAISITLGNGSAAGAALDLTTPDGTLPPVNAGTVDNQIPGRYLSISGLQNPQQLKWTGSPTSSGDIWDGSGVGRAPRVAGNVSTGMAIYKVGDVGGKFNSDASGCHITTDNVIVDWPASGCGNPAFGEGSITKEIAYILPGSGTVTTAQDIELTLGVPAGVFPGEYTGVLTLQVTFS